jgi:hypothetical protein
MYKSFYDKNVLQTSDDEEHIADDSVKRLECQKVFNKLSQEALNAMQKDVDKLTQENRALKEKEDFIATTTNTQE